MKKISAVILTFIMILSYVAVPSFAEDGVFVIDASNDVTKTNGVVTEGIDYHDEAGKVYGADINTIRNISGVNHLALHNGDWVRYDVSGFGAGRFNVIMTYIPSYLRVNTKLVPSTVTLEVDGENVINKFLESKTTQQTTILGEVTLSETSKYLTVKIETEAPTAQYISEIVFEKIVEPGLVSFDAAGKDGDVVARGADEFSLLMETDVDTETVNNNTVKILDANGVALDAEVSSEGKTITLALKETLDYESNYVIYIDGIKSDKGIALSAPVEEAFTTGDKSSDGGSAKVEVMSYVKEGNTITVEGVVYSSCNLGIKGRGVVLSEADSQNSQIIKETETVSEENGTFSLSYTLDENSQAGKREIEVTSDYVVESYITYAFYLTEETAENMKADFSGLASVSEVETQISTYIDYMDVDMEDAGEIIDDFAKVYEKMTNKEFASADDVIGCFKEAIYYEVLNQAKEAEQIMSVLDDKQKSGFVEDFDSELWNILDEDNKLNIAETVIDDGFNGIEDLNEKVIARIKVQKGYDVAELSLTASDVLSGNTLEIIVKSETVLNDVSGIHLDFSYDEESKALFENSDITADSNGVFEENVINSDGMLSIDLSAKENALTVSDDFLTLNIPTNGKSAGSHDATVTGYVLYRPENIKTEGKYIKESINIADELSVEVGAVYYLEKDGVDIIEGGEGVGYHDAGGNNTFETSGTRSIMRTGDWQVYDVSALSTGNYKVSIEGGSKYDVISFAVFVDEDAQITNAVVTPNGEYTQYEERTLGKIVLDGDQKTLRLSFTGSSAIYVKKIMLTKINALNVEEVTSNTGITDEKTSKGADSFSISFNNELANNDYNVVLKDSDGKNILCDTSVYGKKVIINLRESLDYNKDYTITLKNITDIYDQHIEEYSISFKTEGEDVKIGEGKIQIETAENNSNKVTVKGIVYSSAKLGIKGREVKIYTKSQNGEEVLRESGISSDDGVFELSFVCGSDDEGKIEIVAAAEYAKETDEEVIYFYQEETSKLLAEEFSNIKTGENVLEKLRENEDALSISLSTYGEHISKIADGMKNKEFESGAEVIREIEGRFVMEKINSADAQDTVFEIINGKELKPIGEMQEQKWLLLTEEEKQNVASAIYGMDEFENPDDVLQAVNEEINKIIANRNNIVSGAKVTVTSPDITVGQSAELTFTLAEKQENVTKVTIEISYNKDEKLLADGGYIDISGSFAGFTSKIKKEKDKIIYEISSERPSSVKGDILTVSYIAKDGMEGKYNLDVIGYITYYLPEDDVINEADVLFVLESNPTITVSAKKQTSTSPSGSGNGYREPSGSGVSGGSSSGAIISQEPAKTVTDIRIMFTDIEHVAWAKDSINALAKEGILSGRGDGTFDPDDNVTRAEFCKMITLVLSKHGAGYDCDFTDVGKDAWYYTYVASAKAHGLVNGRDDGSFGANDTITREEMAAIAVRALGIADGHETEKFADDAEIASFAKDAVYTLKALGIMDGVGDNLFAPKTNVTRAMAAKVIYMIKNMR